MPLIPPTVSLAILAWFVLGSAVASGIGGCQLGARLQEAETTKALARVRELEHAIETAGAASRSKADENTERIRALVAQLETQQVMEKARHAEAQKQINDLASRTRQCLSPDVVRVLQRAAADRGSAQGADPREPAGAGAGSPALGAGPAGGMSEHAVSSLLDKIEEQYVALQQRHTKLAQAVRPLPCVEIVDD